MRGESLQVKQEGFANPVLIFVTLRSFKGFA